MNLLIKLDIKNEGTWSEICGGGIKVIINHHLEALKRDLEKHTNSTMQSHWYGDTDSNCNKCVFNKNNENDFIEHMKDLNICKKEKEDFLKELTKERQESLEIQNLLDCCHIYFDLSLMSSNIHHKNCSYYKPCNKYMDKLSLKEVDDLIEKLS
ncbi:hypothetical protein [Alkaliphilus sp. B6464]|uniref:hypothetical protein n=1 Tax=Alkaliphilus sp. B6464 TaxID=2731219 RepID=UPI001BABB4CE|nr:hypothetical protein [Alkaliphilus sp. B6464]QUH21940.1 hypothetical protein HYG84_18710 [Alkaliphilus sp. B6464]